MGGIALHSLRFQPFQASRATELYSPPVAFRLSWFLTALTSMDPIITTRSVLLPEHLPNARHWSTSQWTRKERTLTFSDPLCSSCFCVYCSPDHLPVPCPCWSSPKASVPVVIVVQLLDCPSFQYCTSLPWSMIPLSLPPVLQGKFCSFDHAMQQTFLSYTWSVTE